MAEPGPESAWSFLTVADDRRQHQGNQGYDDEATKHYSWDSTVPNHGRPDVGDLCVIRDSRGVLGVSQIDEISHSDGVKKSRFRCRECGSTALKRRSKATPAFRCPRCFSQFDQAVEETIEVSVYRADYARSYWSVGGAITAAELEEFAYLSHSKQQAIRPIDPEALRRLLTSRQVLIGREWWKVGVVVDRAPIPGGFRPSKSRSRIGQGEFRRRLLERSGPVCAFTGPQPEESLHAAHVEPYADNPRHDIGGGLLLRADLHSLFDRGLITIDEDLRVRIDDSLRPFRELARLDGRALRIDSADPRLPTLRALFAESPTKN